MLSGSVADFPSGLVQSFLSLGHHFCPWPSGKKRLTYPCEPGFQSGRVCGNSEHSGLPRSRLRFVSYTGATVIGSARKGTLLGKEEPAPWPRLTAMGIQKGPAVGFVPLMFWHMLHEGCVFLHALDNKLVTLNTSSEPITLTEETPAIATLFYRNHSVVAFRAFVHGMLLLSSVLEAYKLRHNFPYHKVWSILSVDSSSGRTVLLCQSCLIPRTLAYSDCLGNYRDLARFLVFLSRDRLYLSLYIFSECLESENLPKQWQNVANVIQEQRIPATMQQVHAQNGFVECNPKHFQFALPEDLGWRHIVPLYGQLRGLLHAGMETMESKSINNNTRMGMDIALPVAIKKAFEFSETAEPREDASKKLRVLTDCWGAQPVHDWMADVPAADVLMECRERILEVCSCYINGDRATVGVLVLNPSGQEEVVVPALQKAFVGLALYASLWDSTNTYVGYYQRHKAKVRGNIVLRTACWRDRPAFVLEDSSGVQCYSYLAYGFAHQEDTVYPLLFKSVPVSFANRTRALALFLSGGKLDSDCILVKPKLTEDFDPQELRSQVISDTHRLLTQLKAFFGSDLPALQAFADVFAKDSRDME